MDDARLELYKKQKISHKNVLYSYIDHINLEDRYYDLTVLTNFLNPYLDKVDEYTFSIDENLDEHNEYVINNDLVILKKEKGENQL